MEYFIQPIIRSAFEHKLLLRTKGLCQNFHAVPILIENFIYHWISWQAQWLHLWAGQYFMWFSVVFRDVDITTCDVFKPCSIIRSPKRWSEQISEQAKLPLSAALNQMACPHPMEASSWQVTILDNEGTMRWNIGLKKDFHYRCIFRIFSFTVKLMVNF